MDKDFIKRFGFNIKIERQRRSLTQDDLAEMVGISTKHLTRIENGHVTTSISVAYKIAKAMNISIDKLCREEEL